MKHKDCGGSVPPDTRVMIAAVAALLLIAGALYLGYSVAGHRVVDLLYEGRVRGPLGRLIEGQSVHPVEHYYEVADKRVFTVLLYLGRLLLLISLAYLLRRAWLSRQISGLCGRWVLALVFAASVLVRWPHLGRTLTDGERSMAHTLIIHENWDLQGAFKHRFCLLRQYPGEANKFVRARATSIHLVDEEGNGYYSSMPPFSIMMPYLVLRALGIPRTSLSVQWFNMIVHALSAFLFLLVLQYVLPESRLKPAAGVLGAATYLLDASNLFYYSSYYSFDSQWQNFWMAVLLLFFAARERIEKQQPVPTLLGAGLGVSTFLMTYSEFHGLVAAGSIGLYCLVRGWRCRAYRLLLAALILGAAAAVAVTVAQYSTICGARPYLESMLRKFLVRSALSADSPPASNLVRHYLRGFGYLPGPMIALVVMNLLAREKSPMPRPSGERVFLFVTLLPVLLHNALLLEWSVVHWMSTVKATVFLSGILAILVNRLGYVQRWSQAVAAVAIGLVMNTWVASCGRYADRFAITSEDPLRFYITGRSIARTAEPDEVVFAITARNEIIHTLLYYSKRNIQLVNSREEAQTWLRSHGRAKGVLFYINQGDRITGWERIEASDGG